MLVKEIIENLIIFNEKFPEEALLEARAHKEEVTEELLESLRYVNENSEQIYNDTDQYGSDYFLHMYAMFLLSEFREKRAFPIIIDIIQKDSGIVDFLLGDCVTEDLNAILASTFNGDMELLSSVIENAEIDEYVRHAAFTSLNILLNQNVIDKQFVIDYIYELLNDKLEEDDFSITTEIVSFIADNHLFEFIKPVKKLYKEGKVELFVMGNYDSFLDILFDFDSPPLARNLNYIEDAISKMKWWACFDGSEENPEKNPESVADIISELDKALKSDRDEPEPKKPAHTPAKASPKIGRNQLCPCGSGKKYKKCCIDKPEIAVKETKPQDIETPADPYIKKSLEAYPNETILSEWYDNEAIDIDKKMYAALKHKTIPMWVQRNRKVENQRNIGSLDGAFELFMNKCEKENIKTFEEYDEKFSIHYTAEEFIESFIKELNESEYDEDQEKKAEIIDIILSKFQFDDSEREKYIDLLNSESSW